MIVYRSRVPFKKGYLIAEDWPSQEIADHAAKLAHTILTGSGYAGSRNLDAVADFMMGLFGVDASRPYGMTLLYEEDK